MSLLLDTHIFLWLDSASHDLPQSIRKVILRSEGAVHVSAASFWEVAIKRRSGKLVYNGAPRTAAADAGFVELAMDAADGETAGGLDWAHRDPFDRMLVAQCLNRGLTTRHRGPDPARERGRRDPVGGLRGD